MLPGTESLECSHKNVEAVSVLPVCSRRRFARRLVRPVSTARGIGIFLSVAASAATYTASASINQRTQRSVGCRSALCIPRAQDRIVTNSVEEQTPETDEAQSR